MKSTLVNSRHAGAGLVYHENSPIREVVRTCERIAPSDATVLITGETGTGKEVIARIIHAGSRRSRGPLVPVNCGAIPEALLESELFGYVRGAFTGAVNSRAGRLAQAHGGTLFLDEVGEMPLRLQVALLRVIQERTYEAVGSSESVSSDFRLIVATNRDLAAEVSAGRFRLDLYYRLHVCPIELMALRDRPEDICHLFQHFWSARGETRAIEPAAIDALLNYDWPGNVRELLNLVERLSLVAEHPVIRWADLPERIRGASAAPTSQRHVVIAIPHAGAASRLPVNLPELLRRIEDTFVDAALRQSDGSRTGAAELLGIRRTTLVEKLNRRNQASANAAAGTVVPFDPGANLATLDAVTEAA